MSIISKIAGVGIGYFGYYVCACNAPGLHSVAIGIPLMIVGGTMLFGGIISDLEKQKFEQKKNDDRHNQPTKKLENPNRKNRKN